MLIRDAKSSDFKSVLELLAHLNPDDPDLSESKSLPVYSQILASENLSIILAEKIDTIVGTCYLNIIPNLTRGASPYAVIENVVTHPDFRRQGIGRALVASALETAKNKACYKVMLLTGGNKGVQRFYESCGMHAGIKTAFIVRFDGL